MHLARQTGSIFARCRPVYRQLLFRFLASAFFVAALAGCAHLPEGRAYVRKVDVSGESEVTEEEIEEKIATRKTPRFLGLFPGVVYDYEVFDQSVLARDLERVERYYRARGYYRARVRAGRVFYEDRERVRVEILVEEGRPVILRQSRIVGLDAVDPEIVTEALESLDDTLPIGEPFDEQHFIDAEKAVLRALTDNGYAFATVQRSADVDLPKFEAIATFTAVTGPKAVYGDVEIIGLGELPEGRVRRTLDISPGDPYSSDELKSAQRALLDLGVFSSVQVEPTLNAESRRTERVPIKVVVEETKLRGVRLGGGVELDQVRTDVHLIAGWENRNFLGGMRRFRIEFQPGLVFFPTRIPSLEKPTHLLPEQKTRLELRQPGVFEARTNALFRGEFNIFPVLLGTEVDPDAPIIGYRELRGSIGLDRTFGKVYVNPSHNVQANFPFTYAGELDPDLDPVLVSYPELLATLDLRNDQIKPHYGFYASGSVQQAGFGGHAKDTKLRGELRGYVPLGPHMTFGARATAGLLFPQNYGESLKANAEGPLPPPGVSRGDWVRDTQIEMIRGFFSGGPTSNRGYPFRGVGPHGPIPFYDPANDPTELATRCTPGNPDYSAGVCLLPLGGFTLWEASVEMRFDLNGPLSMVTFCDVSDVSPSEVDFRFERLHLSCGPGLRYDTPIGPLRLDIGYRVPDMQVLSSDKSGEGDPGTILGLPIAFGLGVGEAF